ncbi:MAG: DUF4426 domain-containing protein [Lysobacteraceae bacterium]
MRLPFRTLPLALALLALTACGGGDKPRAARQIDAVQDAVARVGDLTVRANAVSTARLDEAVAKQYGIARADDTVLLIVSVRQGPDGQDVAVPADVSVTARTLSGTPAPLPMREVRTGDPGSGPGQVLVDHVGTFKVTPPDTLTFDVKVARDGKQVATLALTREIAAE